MASTIIKKTNIKNSKRMEVSPLKMAPKPYQEITKNFEKHLNILPKKRLQRKCMVTYPRDLHNTYKQF